MNDLRSATATAQDVRRAGPESLVLRRDFRAHQTTAHPRSRLRNAGQPHDE